MEKLLLVRMLGGVGKKTPFTQYVSPGCHEKAVFTENFKRGWNKRASSTQYVKHSGLKKFFSPEMLDCAGIKKSFCVFIVNQNLIKYTTDIHLYKRCMPNNYRKIRMKYKNKLKETKNINKRTKGLSNIFIESN